MTGVDRTLSPLVSKSAQFLLQRQFGAENDSLGTNALRPMRTQFSGTVLFVDISGYTALTESLVKESNYQSGGKTDAAERLTTIINSFFERIISVCDKYAGDVIKFAGDAIIVVFRSFTVAETSSSIAQRAVRCASELQSLTHTEGNYTLTLHMGITSSESLNEMLIGGEYGIFSHLVYEQSAFGELAVTVDHAKSGQTCLATSTYNMVKDYCRCEDAGDGAWLLKSVNDYNSAALGSCQLPSFELPSKALRALVNPAVFEQALLSAGENIAEIRKVSVLFFYLLPMMADEDMDTYFHRVSTSLQIIQRVVYYFEGALGNVVYDEKGMNIIVLFGTPICHEDDEVRASRAGSYIAYLLRYNYITKPTAGVTKGSVFLGSVGSSTRYDWSCMGTCINLAARLMKMAEKKDVDVLFADEVVKSLQQKNMRGTRLSDGTSVYIELEPISLKGFDRPITVHTINRRAIYLQANEQLSVNCELVSAPCFAGREREVRRLTEKLTRSDSGPAVVAVLGHMGIGKSSTISATIYNLPSYKSSLLEIVIARAEPADKSFSRFALWRRVLYLALLRCGTTKTADCVIDMSNMLQLIQQRLAGVGVESILMSYWFFHVMTGVVDTSTGMDTDFINATCLLLIDDWVYKVEASGKRIVLILEDLDRADVTSRALLQFLLRSPEGKAALRNTTIVVSSRYSDDQEKDSRGFLETIMSVTEGARIRLGPLLEDEIGFILSKHFNVKQTSKSVQERVYRGSFGNPMIAISIADNLRKQGALITAADMLQWSLSFKDRSANALPDSIEGNLQERIDRLPLKTQYVLKVCSVLGRRFSKNLVLAVCHDGMSQTLGVSKQRSNSLVVTLVIQQSLRILCDRQILKDNSDSYQFQSPALMEVAYSCLTSSKRIPVHEMAAAYLEKEATPGTASEIARHLQVCLDAMTVGDTSPRDRVLVEKTVCFLIYRAKEAFERSDSNDRLVALKTATALMERFGGFSNKKKAETYLDMARTSFSGLVVIGAQENYDILAKVRQYMPKDFSVSDRFDLEFLTASNDFFANKVERYEDNAKTLIKMANEEQLSLKRIVAANVSYVAYMTSRGKMRSTEIARYTDKVLQIYLANFDEFQDFHRFYQRIDPAIMSLNQAMRILWLNGEHVKSMQLFEQGKEIMKHIKHEASKQAFYVFGSMFLWLRRETAQLEYMAKNAMILAKRNDGHTWSLSALVYQQWCFSENTHEREAKKFFLSQTLKTIADHRIYQEPNAVSYVCAASIAASIDDPRIAMDKGLDVVYQGLDSKQAMWKPDLLRLRAQLIATVVKHGAGNTGTPRSDISWEASLQSIDESIAEAKSYDAKMMVLRTVTAGVRITMIPEAQKQFKAKHDEYAQLLRETYYSIAEHDRHVLLPDLIEASKLVHQQDNNTKS